MPLTRDQMRALFDEGLRAADPRAAVVDALGHPDTRLAPDGRLFVIALGKAACAMAEAALGTLPAPARTLVVTNYENARPIAGAEVIAAGHPVPDENGLRAGKSVLALLSEIREQDNLLVLISGGGSALLPAPVPGLTLADKAEVSRLLLGAGLDIVAMNAVRQHLSELKGGGLLRRAAPGRVTALILSDVIGDDLRAIASGPTAAPLLPRAEVVEMLKGQDLWDQLPPAARAALNRAEGQAPRHLAQNHLIGANRLSLEAMGHAAPDATLIAEPLTGDVAEAAAKIIAMVHAGTPRLALFGGETTVTLRGTGKGGRNQELALRVALALDGVAGWRFLSGGTDGRDGPTDAAGGIVDGRTAGRIRAAGANPEALLENNDSYHALHLAGDLLVTGATGTNVADLQILSQGA